MKVEIFIGNNSQILRVVDVQNGETDDYLTWATVTASLQDQQRKELAFLTLVFDVNTDGTFQANIPENLPLIESATYMVVVNIDAGVGLMAEPTVAVKAVRRMI